MITQAECRGLAADLLNGIHQPGDEYRIALYRGTAELSGETETYTEDGEAAGPGYSAGGKRLEGRDVRGDGALSFADPEWPVATIEADGAVIYNATRGNRALFVLAFGHTRSTAGLFTVKLPTPLYMLGARPMAQH